MKVVFGAVMPLDENIRASIRIVKDLHGRLKEERFAAELLTASSVPVYQSNAPCALSSLLMNFGTTHCFHPTSLIYCNARWPPGISVSPSRCGLSFNSCHLPVGNGSGSQQAGNALLAQMNRPLFCRPMLLMVARLPVCPMFK